MDGNAQMIGYAMAAVIQATIYLSITWFIVYVLLGSLAKVCLIRFMNKDLELRSKRFWPVFVSHFVFSILFVNFFTLVRVDRLVGEISVWLFLLIYFILLPATLDILLLRIIPKNKMFRWLLWTPPMKQVIIINAVICSLSCLAAILAARVL